jgi:sulfatase modifying factor 1
MFVNNLIFRSTPNPLFLRYFNNFINPVIRKVLNIFNLFFLIIFFICSFSFVSSAQNKIKPDTKIKTPALLSYAKKNNFVFVEGGTFKMGCTREQSGMCDVNENPLHDVTLNSFYISKFEVTQRQWQEVMGNNPSGFEDCDECPVEMVNWYDVQKFITKLNKKSRYNFRLPTEAEWEYAARGGNQSIGYKYSGGDEINEVGWYLHNSKGKTQVIGQKKANELGIHDMAGNVREWCSDWHGDYTSQPEINPQGPSTGVQKILRGDSWGNAQVYNRVSCRGFSFPSLRNYGNGFRLVLIP